MSGTRIGVIGAGAWGTALAQVLAGAGRSVTLYARDPAQAAALSNTRRNETYLPGVTLHPGIHVTADLAEGGAAEVLLLTTPAQFMRQALNGLKKTARPDAVLVNCAKGIEIDTGKLLSEIATEIMPQNPYAVLSGPTFAHEVARGLPAAITFATRATPDRAGAWARALSAASFRPYIAGDVIGAEIAGAVKNVIAIACGIVDGKKLGQNAKAAVMTRGMAEIKRLGLHWGAEAESFLGLCGIGDLTLTCNSMSSRNYSLGVALGEGRSVSEIMRARRTVAEGVATARAVALHAHKRHVDMPIAAAVNAILHQNADIDTVVKGLLSRDLKEERK